MKRFIPALALVLAACGGERDAEGERTTAAGEVLGGTISDDMLPLDTVTSQSPPLRDSAESPGGDTEAANTPARADAAQPTPGPAPTEPAAAPAPTETATPEAEQ